MRVGQIFKGSLTKDRAKSNGRKTRKTRDIE